VKKKRFTIFAICFGALLILLVAICWPFIPWIWGAYKYDKVHYGTFQSASRERLELLARQAVKLLERTNKAMYLRENKETPVPLDFKDFDPSYIVVEPKQITIELHGGFDHYGFQIWQSDAVSNQWTLGRYTEQWSSNEIKFIPTQGQSR
jgi:hypothetical protein